MTIIDKKRGLTKRPGAARRRVLLVVRELLRGREPTAKLAKRLGFDVRTVQRVVSDAVAVGFVVRRSSGGVSLDVGRRKA